MEAIECDRKILLGAGSFYAYSETTTFPTGNYVAENGTLTNKALFGIVPANSSALCIQDFSLCNRLKKLKNPRKLCRTRLAEQWEGLTLSLKLKRVTAFPKIVQPNGKSAAQDSHLFVFYDKSTGVAQMRTESAPSMDHTVERVAGSLAMQCLARGQSPDDFMVLVPAESGLVHQLITRARTLLDEARVISGPASLSPRQKEILHSVVSNQANKEIASTLNISVRTVKFHISSLLSKFGVENRNELARRAVGLFRPAAIEDDRAGLREYVREDQRRRDLRPMGFDAASECNSKAKSIRFPGRAGTMSA